MLATIGRAQAVAQFGLVRLSGLTAWLVWCVVHIFLLIELRSRVRVMSEWVWYYLTFKPGARIIYTLQRQAGDEERVPSSRSTVADSKK
jgi:NADH dehydrogenase